PTLLISPGGQTLGAADAFRHSFPPSVGGRAPDPSARRRPARSPPIAAPVLDTSAPPTEVRPDPAPAAPPAAKAKVLLVDDQPANLLALAALLDDLDLELVKATSGFEALRCLLKDDFALILLDVVMPGMDGFEAADLIRQRRR